MSVHTSCTQSRITEQITISSFAEGYHALARARAGPSRGGDDMFASDDDEPKEPPAKRQAREAQPGGALGGGPGGADVEGREEASGAAAAVDANGGEGDRYWRGFES